MSRPRTGTVEWRRNVKTGDPGWHARWTRADGTRTNWTALDPAIPEGDRAAALACAASFAPLARATTRDGTGETVAAYANRWLAARRARTAKDNASHLTHHILPVLGDRSILRLTSSDGDELVASLDKKIAAGLLSDKTARNVWGTCGRMLRDAAHAKPATGLRCLDVNPFRDVMPPERSHVKKAKQFLYPSELLTLMACERVPARWKRNVAIAVYLGPRDGEQRALRWPSVDLDHTVVNLCETTTEGKSRDGTKTGAARVVPIPPALLPLLRAMHEAAGGKGLVCTGIASQRAMARGLRTWLRVAGVTREALFKSSSVNLNIRWHDLRATCGTWLAVEGRPATEIRDILGHTQTSMTDRYMRDATAVRGGAFGQVFPALPPIRQASVMTKNVLAKVAESNAFLRGGRDSNFHADAGDEPISPSHGVIEAVTELPRREPNPGIESAPNAGGSVTTDQELEAAIVRAVTMGLGDVARTLAAQLEERRRSRAGNVVSLFERGVR